MKKVKKKVEQESELYDDIAHWLEEFLKSKHRKLTIVAKNTSRKSLRDFIQKSLQNRTSQDAISENLTGVAAFDIKVDVTGIAWCASPPCGKSSKSIYLAIVEVKRSPISLKDLSQILGYARVVKPDYAFIISPEGWSSSIEYLVRRWGRTDILEYENGRYIVVGKWDLESRTVRPGDTLIPGHFP
jgi:hypothetical protein